MVSIITLHECKSLVKEGGVRGGSENRSEIRIGFFPDY